MGSSIKAFKIRHGYDPKWLNCAVKIYNKTDLKKSDRKKLDKAFKNSFAVVTSWKSKTLIGVGRMLSDGVMYSAIFDVVIDPAFQKQGVGRKIMEALISKVPHTCIHLTSTFGNESFYFKLGFYPHRTAMALYPKQLHKSRYLDWDWKPSRRNKFSSK